MDQDPYQEDSKPSPLQQQVEARIVHNGQMVEALIASEVWQEIIGPQIYDMIGGVIGHQRKDGRWLTGTAHNGRDYSAGYSSGIMEFSNSILDFVRAKDKVLKNREMESKNQKMVMPMEDV